MKLRAYYRISDKSYDKAKLPGADKATCLKSFLTAFPNCELTIVADRITRKTREMLGSTHRVIETDLGNAKSLRFALNLAIDECSRAIAYFAEDDYLYRPGAEELILEGLQFGQYVTLYDHPDKYTEQYKFGEISQVRKSQSSHWRYTLSTCMTFGAWKESLESDMRFWNEHTEGDHPNDHQVFADLNGANRRLAVSIPGWACHTDLTYSGFTSHLHMERWAIDQMVQKLEIVTEKVDDPGFQQIRSQVLAVKRSPWERLQMLDALVKIAGIDGQRD